MHKKLRSILLVDDDEPTNFYHKIIIGEAGCTGHVAVATNGLKALEYLKEAYRGAHPVPDLIFLDINMPVMDGWEFLEEYNKRYGAYEKKMIVAMLTTSINPDDREKAQQYPGIIGFQNKPLTVEMLHEIIEANF